jgi:glycosyltransferase involved in cell wall biosynthesis
MQEPRAKSQEPRAKSQEHYNSALALVKGAAPLDVLIYVPTYNKAENIEPFIDAVFYNTPVRADLLIIDDNSPDGTAGIVKKAREKYPKRLHLLNRPEKQGLAAAYMAAFEWGLSKNYNIFLETDAEFPYNPAYIPKMISERETCDVVTGSRNIQGGGPYCNGIIACFALPYKSTARARGIAAGMALNFTLSKLFVRKRK